jgi:hypothetical protein
MPLLTGSSENVISKNIEELRNSGYGEKQAAAIAYHKAGKDVSTKRIPDINGWIEIKDNPISKVGIFPYLGLSISDELEPNQIYMIYRPAEELSEAECVESFRLLPWINDHETLGPSEQGLTPPEKKGVEGVIGENIYFEHPYLKANLKVFSENLADLIDSGKRELSIGYQAAYDMTPGFFEGEPYDGVQRSIRGNHVALVDQGRSGKDVAVLDHFKFTIDSKELNTMTEMTPELKKNEYSHAADNEVSREEFEELKGMLKKLMGMEKSEMYGDESEEKKMEDESEEKKKSEDESEEEKEKKESEDESEEEKEEGKKEKKVKDSVSHKEFELFKKEQRQAFDSALKFHRAEVNKVNELADQLSNHVGTFDHLNMSLNDIAKYGVKKLKERGVSLQCEKGEELSVLKGYLAAVKAYSTPSARIADSMEDSQFSSTSAWLKKIQGVK